MAQAFDVLTNGHIPSAEAVVVSRRFAAVPNSIEIPISGGEHEEAVDIDLEELLDDPSELCTLLENENVAQNYWTTIALAYAKQHKVDSAISIVKKGLDVVRTADSKDKLSLYNCLCWLYLLKMRHAPRSRLDSNDYPSVPLKDFYVKAATTALNDASRLSPSFPPLFLARGVLCLLRAALVQDASEKQEALRQASKSFDDALRASKDGNMMAFLGKARVLYSLGNYAESLKTYQRVLARAPDLIEPDPRVGIGCCFWQLGHKDDAKVAWERVLELNPDSTIAYTLLGLYHLHVSFQFSTNDPNFTNTYKKAMVQYVQKAFKLDSESPLACATFAAYFLVRRSWATVDNLARKSIELTDINPVAGDGWYVLARKEHNLGTTSRAMEYYLRADNARGGEERGYLPAKFGGAQIKVLQGDVDGAKFQLEKIVQQTKNVEAMSLLGSLFFEDIFSSRSEATKDEMTSSTKKAITLFETVRSAWKDPKKRIEPDTSILLSLAVLYEMYQPEKSLQCLQQVEQIELDAVPEEDRPDDVQDEATWISIMREQLSPQLLNNMACFHYRANRFSQARELFQAALNACIKSEDKDEAVDTDGLVTTISFNLARTYEAENELEEAKKILDGLVSRQDDYVDAHMRLAYIALRQNPDEGSKALSKLYESEQHDLEVRSLYGWFLRKAKKRTMNVDEDQEQRHWKHTLRNHDKHDRYALTAMGNVHLTIAREMRRETEQEKSQRSKMYAKAVEFFDKALQYDSKNAYAAQGIAIALVDDKRDLSTAIQIFSKVKETVRDASVYINLGHIHCELKQYPKAIENYEQALARDRGKDPQVLACLGRAWLLRGRHEKSAASMKTSLDYSRMALQVAPGQIHLEFNIAYVQIQIATILLALPESQRTLEEMEEATIGLDEAIDSFNEIAKSENAPFPRGELEQRASMGKNTLRKQLERAVQSQREHVDQSAAKLQQAREAREVEMARRAEEKQKAEAALNEQRQKIAEERRRMQQRDRELAEKRAEEERRKEEEKSVDEDGAERRKKARKQTAKRKKAMKSEDVVIESDENSDLEPEVKESSATPEPVERERPRKRRRRLPKSKEVMVEDESDMDQSGSAAKDGGDELSDNQQTSVQEGDDDLKNSPTVPEEDGPDEQAVSSARQRRTNRLIDDDEADEEEAVSGKQHIPRDSALAEDRDVEMKDADDEE